MVAPLEVWGLDFVMYHELLHKRHGIRWHNGQARAHAASFREDGQRFERCESAREWLRRLGGR